MVMNVTKAPSPPTTDSATDTDDVMSTSASSARDSFVDKSETSHGPTPEDVIEDIGVGQAQLKALFLGQVPVFFLNGAIMTIANAATVAISLDLHIGKTERSLFATSALLGILVGVAFAGYMGDRFGRRLPTLLSLGMISIPIFIIGFLSSFSLIIMCLFLSGCGIGLGIPNSIAMISENTPSNWRVALRAIGAMAYPVGALYITVAAIRDDPYLAHLHWRMLMFLAGVPGMAFFVLAVFLLPESPVWLASKGLRVEALKEFDRMRTSNMALNVNIQYDDPVQNDGEVKSYRDNLKIVFSKQFRSSTVVCVYASFAGNLLSYGHMYAAPQVFMHQHSNVAPAVQGMIGLLPTFFGVGLTAILAVLLSRARMLALCASIGAAAMVAIVYAGSMPAPRSMLMGGLFQLGVIGVPFGGMGFLTVLFQLAVEIYPIAVSATGASIIIGVGRLGSVIAPMIFEVLTGITGSWHFFYYLVAVVVAAAIPLLLLFDPGAQELSDRALTREISNSGGDYKTCSP